MVKKKTSKKQKAFSLNKMPIRQLKREVKTRNYSPSNQLANKKFIQAALLDSLLDGDYDSFRDIWSDHLVAVNKKQLAEKTHLSRSTVYEAMHGNPTLKTFFKIARELGN